MAWLCLKIIRVFHLRLNNDAVCSHSAPLEITTVAFTEATEGVTK